MTDPELLKVLRTVLQNAQKPVKVLESIDEKNFPKLLFEVIGKGQVAYDLLMVIYHGLTVKQHELSEKEKAIVKEIRNWDKALVEVEHLLRLRGCFLESDLRS